MSGVRANSNVSDGKGLAIGGLVCGIIGLFIANIILGPIALILGLVAHRRAASGMAKAAVILGAVDIVLGIIALTVLSSNGFTW